MAVIETKYSIGDAVWFASTETERRQHPCPDCHGTRKWKAVSPAGSEYDFRCPRCAASYQSNDQLSLAYSITVPSTRQLTIGSVQHNSHVGSYDYGNRYMCTETGVGSGGVYNEDRLFSSHEEALAAAQNLADEANTTTDWIVTLYNKTLELSDYQLENALMVEAKRYRSESASFLWNVNDLFDQIGEADGKDSILELIEDYKNYSRERDLKSVREAIAAMDDEASIVATRLTNGGQDNG